MVQNLSQTGYTSSPGAHLLSFNTPNGLGIEGATPAGLMNIATPAMGASMVTTMSDLGLTGSGTKRNEDEERRVKMRKVLKSIGKAKGRVSEEGLARIGRRVGFQNDIDAEKLTAEERERRVGNRPIFTAGNVTVVETYMTNSVVQDVKVSHSEQSQLQELCNRAGKVLYKDLQPSNGVMLDAQLDSFAANLESLARIDRLSSASFNCFEALSGLYTSLHRLYEQDCLAATGLLRDDEPNVKKTASIEVMCKKSGMPLMHARNRLGLEIAYWKQGRSVADDTQAEPTGDQMDVDGKESEQHELLRSSDELFTLRIEVQSYPAALYPSLRISDAWLPDPVPPMEPENLPHVPWQDVPSSFTASSQAPGAMTLNHEQTLPDLRFIAKLDPPIVMPYQVAMDILSAVGASAPQLLTAPPQYPIVLLESLTAASSQTAVVPYSKSTEQSVLSVQGGEETTVRHNYTLSCANPAYANYGFILEELPFSHPRQLVELLPILRQWASIGALLRGVFDSTTSSLDMNALPNNNEGVLGQPALTLEDLLAPSESVTSAHGAVHIDITLSTSPMPILGLTFPSPLGDGKLAMIHAQILPNAEIIVTQHEGIVPGDGINEVASGQALARALEVCGDLGVWVEWMKVRALQSS